MGIKVCVVGVSVSREDAAERRKHRRICRVIAQADAIKEIVRAILKEPESLRQSQIESEQLASAPTRKSLAVFRTLFVIANSSLYARIV
jgi:hypothetical protein